MHQFDLDALAMAETAHYVHRLEATPGRLVHFDHRAGMTETCILVRPGADLSHCAARRLTRDGWYTVRGGHTPDKWLISCQLDWLTLAVEHWAPSVNWPGGHLPQGPIHRVASIRDSANNTVKFARNNDGPLLFLADWNCPVAARGRYSTDWVANKAGLHVAAGDKPTKGHERIDYGLGRSVDVEVATHGHGGSDHRLTVYTITPH